MSGTTAGAQQRANAESERDGDVRSYDFVRPTCLSREQARTLQLLHEAFAHRLAGVLSPPLRVSVNATAGAIRETAYADLMAHLPQFHVTGVFRMSSECGAALLVAGCDTALFVLERSLGGTATALPEPRWLSDIECTLMEGVLGKILGTYAATWRPLAEIQEQLLSVTSSSNMSHIGLPSDIVCVADFSLEMGSATGAFSLCLPVVACEPVLGKLVLQHWLAAGRTQTAPARELTDKQVTQVRVPVQAILGGVRLTLSEIAGLTVGDIIRLDRATRDEIEIIVGGRTKFFGRPGKTDGRLAVQITREAAPGEGTR